MKRSDWIIGQKSSIPEGMCRICGSRIRVHHHVTGKECCYTCMKAEMDDKSKRIKELEERISMGEVIGSVYEEYDRLLEEGYEGVL